MKVIPTKIKDVLIIEPQVYGDDRGFFLESFNAQKFASETGVTLDFVQDNHSRSSKGVLRGLHYQIQQPQGKSVRIVIGKVLDVAVDMRKSSPTFGQWVSCVLSAEIRKCFGYLQVLLMALWCFQIWQIFFIRLLITMRPNTNALYYGTIPI